MCDYCVISMFSVVMWGSAKTNFWRRPIVVPSSLTSPGYIGISVSSFISRQPAILSQRDLTIDLPPLASVGHDATRLDLATKNSQSGVNCKAQRRRLHETLDIGIVTRQSC